MSTIHIPDELIELLEAHLEPKEIARALHALGELLDGIESRQRGREARFVSELKAWLSTELATKSELTALEGRLRERLAGIEARLAATVTREEIVSLEGRIGERITEIEARLETMATREDVSSLESRLREDMSSLEGRLREDMSSLEGRLREHIADIETRLKALEARLEVVETRLENTATREDLARLDKKFTVYFLILLFTVIFLNQNALEFLARLLGLVR